MSKIFGKPSSATATKTEQSTSLSNNQAFPQLNQQLSPQVNTGTGASNSIAALLGVGGDTAAQAAAFKNFQNSTGYQQQLAGGSQAITGNAASKGLLNSGSTAKGLQTFGQGLADQSYQSYLNPLAGLVNSGNQAAGTIAQAGQQQQSQSTGNSVSNEKGAKKGIGGLLGGGLSLGAKYLSGGAL